MAHAHGDVSPKFKMATAFSGGGQSPTSLSRTLERVFEDAQHTGEINLSGRKLKDYPKIASKYDLADTSSADLSKNRMTEIPAEMSEYSSMDRLNCYHNVIRNIPEAIVQLQSLVHLNLSRNQLSNIPPFICQLQTLEVLLASNNRLVSLPEEIGKLERLMDLDVSCNEITHLPNQIGNMESLKSLNVRKNLLVELPVEISRLKLNRLDVTGNRISNVPCDFRKIDTLREILLQNNPLVSPPAAVCTKGRVHIMKHLQTEAIREDKKRGIMNDVEMRKNFRKSSSIPASTSDEFKYLESPTDRRKRSTVDSGYSTTDSNEKSRWSPSEVNNDAEEARSLALKAAEAVKEQRQGREMGLQQRIMREAYQAAHSQPQTPQGYTPPHQSATTPSPTTGEIHEHNTPPDSQFNSEMDLVDDFTRELQRQKADYEAKKKNAERLRREVEEEEREKDERRRAAMRIQEEQKAILDQQREEVRRKTDNVGSINKGLVNNVPHRDFTEQQQQELAEQNRRIPHSQSFKEESKRRSQDGSYRRTVSESHYGLRREISPGRDQVEYTHWRNNGVPEVSPSPEVVRPGPGSAGHPPPPAINHNLPPSSSPMQEEEFRLRHEAMIAQQRHEAQVVRKRLDEERLRMHQQQGEDEEKTRMRHVQTYISRHTSGSRHPSEDDDSAFSFSRDSTPNTSFNGAAPTKSRSTSSTSTLPPGVQHRLEAMREELNSVNPAFTIRRQIQQAEEEREQMEYLRFNIESRLKVTLPDDLPAALKDGVVLCHLANHIRPRSVSSIHVPSPAVPKLTTAKCRRNVENFLEACRRIGVDQNFICPVFSVLEQKNLGPLANTVRALLDAAANPSTSTV